MPSEWVKGQRQGIATDRGGTTGQGQGRRQGIDAGAGSSTAQKVFENDSIHIDFFDSVTSLPELRSITSLPSHPIQPFSGSSLRG